MITAHHDDHQSNTPTTPTKTTTTTAGAVLSLQDCYNLCVGWGRAPRERERERFTGPGPHGTLVTVCSNPWTSLPGALTHWRDAAGRWNSLGVSRAHPLGDPDLWPSYASGGRLLQQPVHHPHRLDTENDDDENGNGGGGDKDTTTRGRDAGGGGTGLGSRSITTGALDASVGRSVPAMPPPPRMPPSRPLPEPPVAGAQAARRRRVTRNQSRGRNHRPALHLFPTIPEDQVLGDGGWV